MFSSYRTDKNVRDTVLSYYQNHDPHEKIATAKQAFFKSALNYLNSEIKTHKKSILDVGCGFGYFLEFTSRDDWSVFGVEIVDTAAQSAKKRVGEKNIFHGSLKDAQYSDECFDAITLWDVLVMVDSPFEELQECYRILKRRGKIGIRVRNVLFQKMTYTIYFPFRTVAS
jgi:2-polyprenyl-3-methyl-5-hydroxy-6-metoxy-1,4-benzoquinol methylase